MANTFYVYILAGKSAVLYTGMTNNLQRRIAEHRDKKVPGFSQRNNLTNLVWFEAHAGPKSAINREKQIKTMDSCKESFPDRNMQSALEKLSSTPEVESTTPAISPFPPESLHAATFA